MTLTIRPPDVTELPQVAALAAELVALHHETDPARFFFMDNVQHGYQMWLGRELQRKEAVILAAWEGDTLVGYTYGSVEDRDWNRLLDAHGAIHDVFVAEAARKRGVGRKLVESIVAEFERRGFKRVVLSTMVTNDKAQKLFQACGFRPTMIEMTRT